MSPFQSYVPFNSPTAFQGSPPSTILPKKPCGLHSTMVKDPVTHK